jgi:tetratricopeptide (TPR) repeat protein
LFLKGAEFSAPFFITFFCLFTEKVVDMNNLFTKSIAIFSAVLLLVLLLPYSYGGDPGVTGIIVKDRERYYHRLKDMRAKDPTNPELSYQIANLYYSLEMEDEAIKEYRRTLKLKPDHDFAKWFLSRLLESKGYYDEAFWLVRDLIEKHQRTAKLYDRAGEILLKMNQKDTAKEYFARYDELKYGEMNGAKPVKTLTNPKAGAWREYFY